MKSNVRKALDRGAILWSHIISTRQNREKLEEIEKEEIEKLEEIIKIQNKLQGQKGTLTLQETKAIEVEMVQRVSSIYQERRRKEQEIKRQERTRWIKLGSRVACFLAVIAILGGFSWLNAVSARGGWGVSAIHIIAMKWSPRVCEYRRCITPGEYKKHYTLIGLTKDTHYFCEKHIGKAPSTIGQFEPGLALFVGSLLTIAVVVFFLYRVYRAIVVLGKWDEDGQEPSEAIGLLLVACAALYALPTVFSYLIGVGSLG